MPKRTNLFQRVVKVLHENIAGDATVEESAMLPDSASGTDREVDVVITTVIAGQEIRIGVEATATETPADVGWVDSMIGKHSTLPTDKLVLVSEASFTPAAKAKAKSEEISALASEDLKGEEAAGKIVNNLGTVYIKGFTFTHETATATVIPPSETEECETEVAANADLYFSDGTLVSSISGALNAYIDGNFKLISDFLDLANVTETEEREIRLTTTGDLSAVRDGAAEPLFLRNEVVDPPQFWRVKEISVKPKAVVEAGEVPLSHAKMNPLSLGFSFGEGSYGGNKATFVIDESGSTPKGKMIIEGEDGQVEGSISPFSDDDDDR
ncbi:MAG TPA: restriction endonuclease [Solirubrobacterales bacterium]|nr:restriction endonuclease [Solirubrobacterales bacterium]